MSTIVQELAWEEFLEGSKLTPVTPSAFAAIYNESQMVLDITMLPERISFVLGNHIHSKFANTSFSRPKHSINLTMAEQLHQFFILELHVAITTDNTNFVEYFSLIACKLSLVIFESFTPKLNLLTLNAWIHKHLNWITSQKNTIDPTKRRKLTSTSNGTHKTQKKSIQSMNNKISTYFENILFQSSV